MTTNITAKTKKEFEALKMEYRMNGYNFITFGQNLAELEKDGQIIVIEKKRR